MRRGGALLERCHLIAEAQVNFEYRLTLQAVPPRSADDWLFTSADG